MISCVYMVWKYLRDVAVSAWSHCICVVSVYLYLNGLVVSAWSGCVCMDWLYLNDLLCLHDLAISE